MRGCVLLLVGLVAFIVPCLGYSVAYNQTEANQTWFLDEFNRTWFLLEGEWLDGGWVNATWICCNTTEEGMAYVRVDVGETLALCAIFALQNLFIPCLGWKRA